MQGTVKWFSDEKGYGFLEQPNGPDVFVHYSGIFQAEGDRSRRALVAGQHVEFEMGSGPKGPQAVDVRVTS